MSWIACPDPIVGDAQSVDAIEGVVIPRIRDVDGLAVERVLPVARRRMVGPFIFFDQMGPSVLDVGEGLDVRPHPHIGLSTVTYLFEGQVRHQDSLGVDRLIEPGELNLMTAGRGVVHSERSTEISRRAQQNIFGIQSWIALPEQYEEQAPSFEHFGANQLPLVQDDGLKLRVILGDFLGVRSPVKTWGEPFYVDAFLEPGATLKMANFAEERAIYIVSGALEVDGTLFDHQRLLVIREGLPVTVKNPTEHPVRLMLLGGDIIDGPRHIWWNFVSSSKERIEQAKEEWRTGKFDIVPGDPDEFTPLPGD